MQDSQDDAVARQIRTWRDALIDLTRRNPLLSLSTKGKSNLCLTEPSPDELYALLASKRRTLMFVPETQNDQPSLTLEGGTLAPRPHKAGIVPLSVVDMKSLNTLRQRSALTLQEQGINTLFVAIGLLEWPDPQIKTLLLSPLLLVPDLLERTPGEGAVRLRRFDEDVELNPTLLYRLSQRDMQLILPPFLTRIN